MKRFLAAIKNSMPLKHAAAFAGLSYDTVNRWRIRGGQADAPAKFRHFCKALMRAQAASMYSLVAIVQSAGRKDWKAATWLLERRHAPDFGRAVDSETRGQAEVAPSPSQSPWENHPVKREIAERKVVRSTLKKIADRLSTLTRDDWDSLRERQPKDKSFERRDWSVKRPSM